MSFQPTPRQTLLLLDLTIREGAAMLEGLPKYEPADRRPLVAAKFIRESSIGRRKRLHVEDQGWAWIGAHLTAKLPAPQNRLALLLAKLDAHLKGVDKSFADFIGPPSQPEPEPPPRKPRPKATRAHKAPARATSSVSVRDRLESAYLHITGGGKDRMVPLARMRAALADLDRATVDAALAQVLKSDDKATLMSNDDPGRLSPTDREAAFNLDGQSFHYLWIAS